MQLDQRLQILRKSEQSNASVLQSASKHILNNGGRTRENFDDERKLLGMIRDMQQSKDAELRYQIEKEQITRAIKNQSRETLGEMGEMKRRELEQLSQQRDDLRGQETRLRKEVEQMENKLIAQEQLFQEMERNVQNESKDVRDATMKNLKSQEMQFVTDHAQQVARIRDERQRLENERVKIMNQLANVNRSRQISSGNSLKHAGANILTAESKFRNFHNENSHKLQQMRDRQVDSLEGSLLNMDDIDVLYKDVDNKPKIYHQVGQIRDNYLSRQNDPMMARNLQNINNALERLENNNRMPIELPQSPIMAQKLDKIEQMLSEGRQNPQFYPDNDRMQNIERMLEQLRNQMNESPKRHPQEPVAPASYQPPKPDKMKLSDSDRKLLEQNLKMNSMPQMASPPVNPYHDPTMVMFQNMIKNQEDENRKLRNVLEGLSNNIAREDELQGSIDEHTKRLQDLAHGKSLYGPGVIPDDFVFRQNEPRCSDLEYEERALMNLAAQELDQLRLIQNLPKDSELYHLKLQQFKELSAMRVEVEKVLQEQRLEKIKRDFQKQKIDEERSLRHQIWLDQQKMNILASKLNQQIGPQALNVPSYNNIGYPQPVSQPGKPGAFNNLSDREETPKDSDIKESSKLTDTLSFKQGQQQRKPRKQDLGMDDPDIYNPAVGLILTIDFAGQLPREIRTLRVVLVGFDEKMQDYGTFQAGPINAEADLNWRDLNKVIFQHKELIKGIPEQEGSKLVFEIQTVDKRQQSGYTGVGWTWIDLFHGGTEIAYGKWQLPIYAGQTKPDQTQNAKLYERAANVNICIKIGLPGDDILNEKVDIAADSSKYLVPIYHQIGKEGQKAQIQNQRQQSIVSNNQSPQKTPQKLPQPGGQSAHKKPDLRKPQQDRQPNQIDMQQPQIADANQEGVIPPAGLKKDSRYKCKGLRVRCHFVQTEKLISKFMVRCMMWERSNQADPIVVQNQTTNFELTEEYEIDEDEDCIKAKPGQAIFFNNDGQVNISNVGEDKGQPLTKNRVIRVIEDFEFVWDSNFYEMYIAGQGNKQYVLSVDIWGLTQNQRNADRQSQAYATLEINDREDGKIRYGYYNLTLNKGDLSLNIEDQQPLDMEILGISLLDPAKEKQSLYDKLTKDPSSTASSQFKPNFDKQLTMSEFFKIKEEQLNIYIDAARLLPENVSLTKIVVRIVDKDLKDLVNRHEIISDPQSSFVRNQNYGLCLELQLKNPKPSALVFIQMETFSQSSRMPRIVGQSFFPLFLDKQTEMPFTFDTSQAERTIAHIGNYQMPLYHCKIPETKPFTYQRFINKDKVPGSSILIRVRKVPLRPPKSELEREPAPPYNEGVFSTKYFITDPDEVEAMRLRRKRKAIPLMNVLMNVIRNQGQDPTKVDVIAYLFQLIKTDKKSELIDLTFHSTYEPSLGVRFNVESIYNHDLKLFFGSLASILPKATYYDPNRTNPPTDAFLNTTPDYESMNSTFCFNEGDEIIRGFVPEKDGMSILIDIKAYDPVKDIFYDFGFSIVPLLTNLNTDADDETTEYYVNSGYFALPVYSGKISPELVDALLESTDPMALIAQKQLLLQGKAAVIIKIIDTQRKFHFRGTLEEQAIDYRFMPANLRKSHEFKITKPGMFNSTKPMKDLVPAIWKKKSSVEFSSHIDAKFKAFMNLN